jgi:plasmid replication initiation protein
LQEAIRRSLNGQDYGQLELFSRDESVIRLSVPLGYIATPAQYAKVRESAKQLAGVVVSLKKTDEQTGEKYLRFTGLFSEVQVPMETKRSSYLTIEIKKDVAKMLIEIDRGVNNRPKNYTGFNLQIANSGKNKYTSRIYKLISSWKEKGGFYMTLNEFRDWLQLDNKYNDYSDIKKRILLPVQEELKEKADCWFNCSEGNFERKEGKKVVGLHFKVITPEFEETQRKISNNVKGMLKLHFKFTDDHLKQLAPIFNRNIDINRIQYKILQLNEQIREKSNKISNPQAYIIRSLLNEFNL